MKITKTAKFVLSSIFVIWIVAGIGIFTADDAVAVERYNNKNIYTSMKLFSDVLFKLNRFYVSDVAADSLVEDAIMGMLKNLDPHTNYFKPDDFSDFQTNTKGEFGGLGITIDKQGDYITVVSPIEGTPAYKMGILAGDKIAKVDTIDVKGYSTTNIIKIMRGDKGTKVKIGIIRPGVDELLEFDIVRDIIKIKSIPYAYITDKGIGYLRIRQFSQTTSADLIKILDDFEEKGIKGLLIDLRFNPGGLLNEAIDTVNEFVGPNKLVVSTKGRNPISNQKHYTKNNRMRSGYPVVCLINEGSASAAEIFSGSLQDWDKGLVVGKTSFGKGSVQQLMPLIEGKGIKITVSKYYIHSGRCIHKDINDKILKGKKVTDSEKEKAEEEAHKKVFYTEKGRKVYGGGGINPDIEIEQDIINEYQIDLNRKNLFFEFAVNYMLKNEKKVTENFKVDDRIFNEFVEFACSKKVECTQKVLNESKAWIKNRLSADIVAKKFGDLASYKILSKQDGQLQKALALFDKYDTMQAMFDAAEKENELAKAENKKIRDGLKSKYVKEAEFKVSLLKTLLDEAKSLPEGSEKSNKVKALTDLHKIAERQLERLNKNVK